MHGSSETRSMSKYLVTEQIPSAFKAEMLLGDNLLILKRRSLYY